jgi:hypothetical protein
LSKSDLLKDIEKAIKDIDLEDLLESLGEKISADIKLNFSDDMKLEESLIALKAYGLMSGLGVGKPVFIFKDEEENRSLPIRLGNLQASIIALSLGPNIGSSIFGAVGKILKSAQLEIIRIVFDSFDEQRLMGRLEYKLGDKKKMFRSSAEELLALGLELEIDFFTSSKVLDRAKSMELDKEQSADTTELSADPEQIGQKYLI